MRIYLDLCCLNRPFDDQAQPRIYLETQALALLMERVASGRHTLSGSAALIAENEQNRDEKRKAKVRELLKQATEWIPYPSDVDPRVKSLSMLGFRGFDAHHVAAAEAGECDRLVTCDDQFLKVARRAAAKMKVAITDLLSLVSEPDF